MDLNVDLGELPDEPDELFALATVVNIACGGHAGDPESMHDAVRRAIAGGARIVAHPAYPDREGFGRRRVSLAPDALEPMLARQCADLAAIALGLGGAVIGVKPHGALYHDAGVEPATARAVVHAAVCALGGPCLVVGPAGSALAFEAAAARCTFAREGFADRGYREDGGLVARGDAGALLVDPAICVAQARRLVRSGAVDTLCVHGDTPSAVAIARAVRQALTADGAMP